MSARSRLTSILKWTLIGALALVIVLILTVLMIARSQDGSVKVLQAYLYNKLDQEPNSFEPRSASADTVRDDGVRIRTNLKYGTTYPNSFLDIWYPTADDRASRPTLIYMHGGGFFMGSKDWGDPLAAGGDPDALSEPIELIAKQGFNVVNIDYALAPAYRYPVPLLQLNEAIGFLRTHAQEYGLDMTRVFIMGGSAGAQLSAQYGVVLSDPAYAAEVGIEPTIDPSHVKGLVLFSPPLKVSGFGWRMNSMMWAYLNTQDLENSPQARQVDILSHINPRYPPTYITDGNQPDTFPEHAKAMAQALTSNGIDHVFNYYEASEALLDHGYTGRLNTKHGRDNLGKAIAFMRQRSDTCPLARAPYSVDTPLVDLMLNAGARDVLKKHGFLDKMPPQLGAAQPPTFLAIVSTRIIGRYFGLSESVVDAIETDLASIPVTDEDSRERCARYDTKPPEITVPTQRPAILVFDKSVGFRDGPSVEAANALLGQIAARRGWSLVLSSNAAVFDASTLQHFDAVVWNNVSGDVLTLGQRAALRDYVEKGGGFAGFHGSAGDPLYLWDWYADSLIGARFAGHPSAPQFQTARLIVEDRTSEITRDLGSGWTLSDEWYSFKESPRARGAHILVTIDERSYRPMDGKRDLRMGSDHPIAWTRCVGKGRSFYSAIGHRPEVYSDTKAVALLEGGIAWAAGILQQKCPDVQETSAHE